MSRSLDLIRNGAVAAAFAIGLAACGDRDEADPMAEHAEEAMQEAEDAMEDAAEAAEERWEDTKDAMDDEDEDEGAY